MLFRIATTNDIRHIHDVRLSVKENVLSNPAAVIEQDYRHYLTVRGKGWVCEENGVITGFAIIDLQEHNVWALFVYPHREKNGIGKELHRLMMNWYFRQTDKPAWLSTERRSRAEAFYRKAGWKEVGVYGQGDVKFEMSGQDWQNHHR